MKRFFAWAICALWMGIIFAMSAMPGDVSAKQSGTVTRIIMAVLAPIVGEQGLRAADLSLLELLVRKAAHMAEYAVLFFLYRRALRLSGVRRASLCALLMSAAYAATDEFHQCFTAGRGPSPVDVMIDTAGAALCWAVIGLWGRIGHGARARGEENT
ncbi:MAG: VanZ family protein [Clostridia bacterium]|nr:VanZ family protein [Clostridia bacterium]